MSLLGFYWSITSLSSLALRSVDWPPRVQVPVTTPVGTESSLKFGSTELIFDFESTGFIRLTYSRDTKYNIMTAPKKEMNEYIMIS
jgi:hypothetical protein